MDMILVKRMDGSFLPATEDDQELSKKWRVGKAVKFKATQQSDRSLQHHRLYFGGLLKLAFDYWEPEGGLLTPSELATLDKYNKFLCGFGGNEDALTNARNVFTEQLTQSRAGKIQAPEKSKEALHEWVKIEAGWCELEQTPRGIRKIAKSINFNAMPKEEFEEFYKAAFSVCWRFILSRTFTQESEADNAINCLIQMG
tara:strand:+ start:46284 stop:46880 length:597 start_codon:yes stop_codon:yes gene_type:complete